VSYNPNIPVATDFRAVSQRQILSNFQAIASAWLENHVPLTANKNVGKHEVLTLRAQVVDPATTANQSAIYNKLVGGVPQLFFRPNTNQTPIQLTNSNLNTLQTGATGDAQSSFIAGPFTIYFGFFLNCPNAQVITVLPLSTLVYVGLSTALTSTVTPGIATTAAATNMAANTFVVSYNTTQITSNPTIYYTAIGI
jgi:hypothetical protein